ncbi:MAG TPA: hypothetical protein VFA53_03480 [Xanthobacteraceae bacterium]|nr:hypothetical protein [Xanthobacteraceae bacterium]
MKRILILTLLLLAGAALADCSRCNFPDLSSIHACHADAPKAW